MRCEPAEHTMKRETDSNLSSWSDNKGWLKLIRLRARQSLDSKGGHLRKIPLITSLISNGGGWLRRQPMSRGHGERLPRAIRR